MRFSRFTEGVATAVSRPWFFYAVLLALAAWLPTLVLLDPGISDLIVDSISNPVSLVLLVLLHNSSYRSERATDERLDQLAEGLAHVLRQLSRAEGDRGQQQSLEETAAWLVRMARAEEALSRGEVDEREME